MRDTPSDVDPLLAEIRKGENREENFRSLYERYRLPVVAVFRRQGFSAEDCDDLVQETFLRAFRALPKFQGQSRFRTWLYEIALNVARNTRRNRLARKRDMPVDSLEPDEGGNPEGARQLAVKAPEHGPLQALLSREAMRRLRGVVKELPNRMRRCFLWYCQGHKFREIAVLEQVSIDTVKSQLAQAKKRVRRELSGELGGVSR